MHPDTQYPAEHRSVWTAAESQAVEQARQNRVVDVYTTIFVGPQASRLMLQLIIKILGDREYAEWKTTLPMHQFTANGNSFLISPIDFVYHVRLERRAEIRSSTTASDDRLTGLDDVLVDGQGVG